MFRRHLALVAAMGLSAAGCSYNTRTEAIVASPLTGSEQACLDYGFTAGTAAYSRCVSREHEARVRGRVARDYAEAQLAADARDACYAYGLEPGTATYDRCVGREIDARRYRNEATYVPPPSYEPPPPPVRRPPAGVEAFRDEYGFRYDGQGNRIDRNGNIISPQSTTP